VLKAIIKWLLKIWRRAFEQEQSEREDDAISSAKNGVWCVIANVVEERPYGEDHEMRKGTKHFRSGAKVYCFPMMWGDGYENVRVVGRHRGSNRYVTMIIRSAWLTNWRAKVIYSPEVIRRLEGRWDGSKKSKEMAEKIADLMQRRTQDEKL